MIQVERLNPSGSQKKPRPLWLVGIGEQFLELEDIWSQYARRFGVDHWYRFAKQRLHWTLPSLSTTQQCERWSDLMRTRILSLAQNREMSVPLITWQLWLAKKRVSEHHLPWQSPVKNLTPGRVAQSMFSLLVEIGTPATSPKTRGKSLGWKKGQKRTKRKTYPLAKKTYSSAKKSKKRSEAVLGVSPMSHRFKKTAS